MRGSDSVWHAGVRKLLDGTHPNHDRIVQTRIAALRRQADRYGPDSMIPWPRLAQSFIRDAEALESMLRDRKMKKAA